MRHTTLLLVTLLVTPLAVQDVEFIRALERAQADRPAAVESSARIAPDSEPGTPLVIHGRVFAEDGRTPLKDAIVFAYHTDSRGLYDTPGAPAHSWRLQGWAKADADGRFEFRTIRPGSYPSGSQAAHVHFTVFTTDARYHGGALEFDDDPLLDASDRARANASGEFGTIRRVRREGDVQHVDFNIRVQASRRF